MHCGVNFFTPNPVDETRVVADSSASSNHQAAHNDDVPSKGPGKKQKNETDKGKGVEENTFEVCTVYPLEALNCISDLFLTENTEVKLKELLSGLSTLTLSEAETFSVMNLLRDKSPNVLDAWQKVRD